MLEAGGVRMKTIIKGMINPAETPLELKNRALARMAAAQSFVLLENDGILPLREKRIALYGSGV